MPRYLAPGVYVEEIRGTPTIEQLPSDVAAFVGRCERGPVGQPLRLNGAAEFRRYFGDETWAESHLPASVKLFFANGGRCAVILRHHRPGVGDGVARLRVAGLGLRAASPGAWGNSLDAALRLEQEHGRFTLELRAGSNAEQFNGLTLAAGDARRLDRVLEQESQLARVEGPLPVGLEAQAGGETASGGDDGLPLQAVDHVGADGHALLLRPLESEAPINLLCLPPCRPADELPKGAVAAAQDWCRDHGVVLLIDPPLGWTSVAAALAGQETLAPRSCDSAVYLPRLLVAGQPAPLVPCGAVAGVIARTDATRGVWKSPAGSGATLGEVAGLAQDFDRSQQDQLNPAGINLLRTIPPRGPLVWGGRTRAVQGEVQYLNHRRTLLMVEHSLRRGLAWAVFEPNGEPLWRRVRESVTNFLQELWRQGAFVGQSPREAYFLRCDGTTMTQADLDAGQLICEVGVALLKPAEFAIVRIRLTSGAANPPAA